MAADKERREVEIIINGQKANASLKELDAAAALTYNQFRKMSADDPGRQKLLDDYHELKGRANDVRTELKGATESSSLLTKALAFGGVTVGVEAVFDGIKELGAEVINTTKEVATLRGSINGLTGATGKELDGLTTSVMAVGRTFGKDFNEVLQAGNALSKQMGISQQEAMRLIEQGFKAGADSGGDFLDQVKEYAPQFKAAGLSAGQFIGQITQSVTTGVFSDKGADVVKEFGLRIKEQTSATSDAMQAAFGPAFTKQIFDGINNGSMTSAEALQRVAKEIDETKIPAAQLQTVIADVFGGPGEDAGIDYIKSLKNVGKGVDELVDTTNVYIQRQAAQLASEKELAAAQNELAKSFEGGSTIVQTLTNQAMTVLYTLLVSLGATFRELAEPVQMIWAQLLELGKQMGFVGEAGITAKGVGEALGFVFRLLLTPTRFLITALSEGVKMLVNWTRQSESAQTVLSTLGGWFRTLYKVLSDAPAYFEGFSAAAKQSFTTIGKAIKSALTGDFEGAKAQFASLGQSARAAFDKAFAAANTPAPITAEGSVRAGGEEGPTREAGGNGTTAADAAKAAKARETAAAKAKAARERAQKAEEEAERKQQELLYNLAEGAVLARGTQRERELAKIEFDALRRTLKVTGSEKEKEAAILLIMQEAEQKKQDLLLKFEEEDRKARDAAFKQSLADEDAAEVEREAAIQGKFEDALLNEQERDQLLYEAKHASLEAKMALEEAYSGKTGEAYRKTYAELEKLEKDHNKQVLAEAKKREEAKRMFAQMSLTTAGNVLSTTIDILGQDEAARKKNAKVIQAFTVAKIAVDATQEVQGIWRNYNSNPAINALFPGAGAALAAVQTLIATTRAAGAANQVMTQKFAAGGATGSGLAMSPTMLQELTGRTAVGSNGKLIDDTGFAIAGVVHEDEYVIPKWMREDPKVMQVEQWLENKRLRKFAEGGLTGGSGGQGSAVDVALPGSGSDAEVLQQLVGVLMSLDRRLVGVEQWQQNLRVLLSTRELEQRQATDKAVELDSKIR